MVLAGAGGGAGFDRSALRLQLGRKDPLVGSPSGGRAGSARDALDVAGCEEFRDRDGVGDDADEPVGVVLVAVQGGKQPAICGAGGSSAARWQVSSYIALGRLVPVPLVAGQRAGERLAACEAWR